MIEKSSRVQGAVPAITGGWMLYIWIPFHITFGWRRWWVDNMVQKFALQFGYKHLKTLSYTNSLSSGFITGHPVFELLGPLSIIQSEVVPFRNQAERFECCPNGSYCMNGLQAARKAWKLYKLYTGAYKQDNLPSETQPTPARVSYWKQSVLVLVGSHPWD